MSEYKSTVSISINTDLLKKIDRFAKKTGRSRSSTVEKLVETGLKVSE